MRRGVVGLDGAVSEYCDLSGRGLTTIQVERTLRVFETAVAIDVSNNEIDKLPSSIPKELVALDISFNLISSIQGIERLQHLQELHLGFNRLTDVSVLEFCPQLVRVNLSGNRLMNTKGIETLPFLENLDLSENLIEFPDALRPLSLNQSLTHLSLRGNPISVKADYRVLLLDMIPSVLMLDNKKIRTTVKYKTHDGGPAAKSLSYSRLYDDKKQFIMRNQNRQTTTATMARKRTLTNSANPLSSTTYEGSTMFLQTQEPVQERVRSLQLQMLTESPRAPPPPPPASVQLTTVADNDANVSNNGSTIPSGGMYMSIYDRLAQANGLTTKPPEPVSDVPKQQEDRTSKARSTSMKQLKSTISPRQKTRAHLAQPVQPQLPTASARKLVFTPDPKKKTMAPMPAPVMPAPLDAKQRNVLNVIQNLIQHKKQTLATLALHQSTRPVTAPTVS